MHSIVCLVGHSCGRVVGNDSLQEQGPLAVSGEVERTWDVFDDLPQVGAFGRTHCVCVCVFVSVQVQLNAGC